MVFLNFKRKILVIMIYSNSDWYEKKSLKIAAPV